MTPDDKLKAALAKMLPEVVNYEASLRWVDPLGQFDTEVLDTELLHLCSLVESGLSDDEFEVYAEDSLWNDSRDGHSNISSFIAARKRTWQQLVTALAKIKNIEI